MALGLREIYELSVPQYLALSIASPIAAFMIVAESLPTLVLLPVILALSFAVLGFNTSNMIFDAELDAINKPRRPIPSGRTSKKEAMFLSSALYLSALVLAATVNFEFVSLIVLFIALSLAYSMPPLRLRNFWWGSSIVGAVLYGVIPFLSAELSAGAFMSKPVFFLFFTGLIAVISNTKDSEDLVGERKMKISSLPLILGQDSATQLTIVANFLLLSMMTVFSLNGVISQQYFNAALLSFVIFLLATVAFVNDMTKIKVRNFLAAEGKKNDFNETLQSDAVTISVLYVVVIQLIFGIFSAVPLISP